MPTERDSSTGESMSESFASMFESEEKSRPKRGTGRGYNVGQPVEGRVVRIGRDAVFIELDGKSEGYLEDNELKDGEGNLTVKVGDLVRAVVVSRSADDGVIRLGKSSPKGQ